MIFEDITVGKTEVRYGTGTTHYVVMGPPDTHDFVLLKQTTGPSAGKYYLVALKAIRPVPVKYPMGYQLIYAGNIGQIRSRAAGVRGFGARVPIAVKVHLEDGGTITIPWKDWIRSEQAYWVDFDHNRLRQNEDDDGDFEDEDDEEEISPRGLKARRR